MSRESTEETDEFLPEGAGNETPGSEKPARRLDRRALRDLIGLVITACVLVWGVQSFVIKPYGIPSESMEGTLEVGDRVFVNRLAFVFDQPEAGDVAVFHPPAGVDNLGAACAINPPKRKPGQACSAPLAGSSEQVFVKRIVAGPGDRLQIAAGEVILNGKAVNEPYTEPCVSGGGCDFNTAITIPDDHFFMLGDNRGESFDSRFWGPVPRSSLIGEAFFSYWPLPNIGLLD